MVDPLRILRNIIFKRMHRLQNVTAVPEYEFLSTPIRTGLYCPSPHTCHRLQHFTVVPEYEFLRRPIRTGLHCRSPHTCHLKPLDRKIFEIPAYESMFSTTKNMKILQISIQLRSSEHDCRSLDSLLQDTRWKPTHNFENYEVWRHANWEGANVSCTRSLSDRWCTDIALECAVLSYTVRTRNVATARQLALLRFHSMTRWHEAEWPLVIAVFSVGVGTRCPRTEAAPHPSAVGEHLRNPSLLSLLPVIQYSILATGALVTKSCGLCCVLFVIICFLMCLTVSRIGGIFRRNYEPKTLGFKFGTILKRRTHFDKTISSIRISRSAQIKHRLAPGRKIYHNTRLKDRIVRHTIQVNNIKHHPGQV